MPFACARAHSGTFRDCGARIEFASKPLNCLDRRKLRPTDALPKLGSFSAGAFRNADATPRNTAQRKHTLLHILVGLFAQVRPHAETGVLRRCGSSRLNVHGSGPEQSSGLGVGVSIEMGAKTPWVTSLKVRESRFVIRPSAVTTRQARAARSGRRRAPEFYHAYCTVKKKVRGMFGSTNYLPVNHWLPDGALMDQLQVDPV